MQIMAYCIRFSLKKQLYSVNSTWSLQKNMVSLKRVSHNNIASTVLHVYSVP